MLRRFLQGAAKKRQSLGEKSLFGSELEGGLRSGRKKSGAVRAGIGASLPVDGANVFIRGAIAILAVLRADTVPILRNLPGDPVCIRERSNHVAHQLCFADGSGVAADDNYAPANRCIYFTYRQVSPLVL